MYARLDKGGLTQGKLLALQAAAALEAEMAVEGDGQARGRSRSPEKEKKRREKWKRSRSRDRQAGSTCLRLWCPTRVHQGSRCALDMCGSHTFETFLLMLHC